MRYWATGYDWRKVEARLNALPMFMTQIDGPWTSTSSTSARAHEDAMPMILTHGWPGLDPGVPEGRSIRRPKIPPPTAARPSDAFHLVIPSIPGFGFSGQAQAAGLGLRPHRPRLVDR